MEENTQAPAETADTAMAEAVAEALGTNAGTTSESGEEETVEAVVDPTGRLDNPGESHYHWGTGRRKESVARVRVRPGAGVFQVNGKDMTVYFTRLLDHGMATGPLTTLKVGKKVDVFVNTHGGGVTGQAGAVRMGLGRALMALYPDAEQLIRSAGHLSRDSRMVERKKYGRHGARRGHQWGKR